MDRLKVSRVAFVPLNAIIAIQNDDHISHNIRDELWILASALHYPFFIRPLQHRKYLSRCPLFDHSEEIFDLEVLTFSNSNVDCHLTALTVSSVIRNFLRAWAKTRCRYLDTQDEIIRTIAGHVKSNVDVQLPALPRHRCLLIDEVGELQLQAQLVRSQLLLHRTADIRQSI